MAVISFARGAAAPESLPVDVFGECARIATERDGRTALNYGPAAGYAPLREWIGERHGVDPARVLVTNGSIQGFGFIVRHLFHRGGSAVVEAPTYDRVIVTLRELGVAIRSVPLGEGGLDVDALEDELDGGGSPELLYVIPTFQNPSGWTLSLERRRQLAELVNERGLLLYEDDPYGEVRFEGERLPSLFELAGGENVIFSSSFSKTVGPGLRVGYFVLPERLVRPVEAIATASTISPGLFVQAALNEFLRQGRFEPNLQRVREILQAKRDAMLLTLEREMPEGARWSRPQGGYFLWLDFPPGARCAEVFARAAEAGVTFVKGTDFFADGSGQESARLAFSFAALAEIPQGIARLAGAVRETAPAAR